jgi:hypothetical protein
MSPFPGAIMNKLITLFCVGIMLIASSTVIAGPQQEKMKSCNKAAKTKSLKGDERKAFMKSCLSGKTASAADPKLADAANENKSTAQK